MGEGIHGEKRIEHVLCTILILFFVFLKSAALQMVAVVIVVVIAPAIYYLKTNAHPKVEKKLHALPPIFLSLPSKTPAES